MKPFLWKCTAFTALQLTLLALCYARYSQQYPPADNYHTAVVDKHHLIRTQASPRMIFIGGSSVAFGIDSTAVAWACGFYPVNMAVHLRFGLNFMLAEVEPHLRAGDVVIFSPEYHGFEAKLWRDAELIAFAVENDPAILVGMPHKQIGELLDRGMALRAGRILRATIGAPLDDLQVSHRVYRRGNFNSAGDFVGHHNLKAEGYSHVAKFKYSGNSMAAIQRLNAFHQLCQKQGVRVFYSHPPYLEANYLRDKDLLKQFDDALRKSLTIPMLDSMGEMVFPSDYFYDSGYHLNLEGKTKRSSILAARLKTGL